VIYVQKQTAAATIDQEKLERLIGQITWKKISDRILSQISVVEFRCLWFSSYF